MNKQVKKVAKKGAKVQHKINKQVKKGGKKVVKKVEKKAAKSAVKKAEAPAKAAKKQEYTAAQQVLVDDVEKDEVLRAMIKLATWIDNYVAHEMAKMQGAGSQLLEELTHIPAATLLKWLKIAQTEVKTDEATLKKNEKKDERLGAEHESFFFVCVFF